MADQKQVFNSIVHKYKDLGDGSFAEVVALEGGVTISSVTVSDVEISNDSGNPVPVSGIVTANTGLAQPLTDTQLRAEAVSTEPLGIPSVARQLTVTTTSASVALTATCKRISIRARGTDMRYVVGTGAQTASATTSHFIAQDERLDIAVPLTATIAAIRESAATINGSLAITELI